MITSLEQKILERDSKGILLLMSGGKFLSPLPSISFGTYPVTTTYGNNVPQTYGPVLATQVAAFPQFHMHGFKFAY
jgi:hypothetical protein